MSDSEEEQQLVLDQISDEDMISDASDDDEPMDIITKQRVTVNNEAALKRLESQIALPKNLPWTELQSITSSKPVTVTDPDDDLSREVAFYEQALEAAIQGRELIKKEKGVFERPDDYFAEMIKTDEHMSKIRQKLLDENASIQASERAKAQRDLKKFGKKVQTEKRLEREKAKADALEKIQTLKKKRQGNETNDGKDEFDIALESEDEDMKAYKKSGKGDKGGNKRSAPSTSTTESRGKRLKKNQKFGFGGKKRNQKSNDADSSADASGFSLKRNNSTSFKSGHKAHKVGGSKGGAKGGKQQRPGKARRQGGGGGRK